MARRPAANDDDISLFPFLSIVACVIGVLTLMIATVTVQQMNTADASMISAYEDGERALKQQNEALEKLKQRLDEKLGPAVAQMRQQADLKEDELEKLVRDLEKALEELEKLKKTKVVIPTLDAAQRESLASMKNEMQELAEQVAQLEKDLSTRKESSQSRVTILPSGSGVNFKPHFVECAQGSLVLHDLDPPKTIRAAEMVTDKDFLNVLSQVAGNVNDTVVFLLRSDGLNTYNAAKKLCDDRNIRHGRLPVVGEGKVDLSAFREAAAAADGK
ncbi:MAG TPA: hypothetical protein VGE52_05115 [Pirellulales bacterium]